LSIKTFSEEYSNKIWGEKKKDSQVGFPTWSEVYTLSKVGWDELYEAITVLSVRTSNSHTQIMDMEFYQFNLLMKYLNIYIDKENKAQEGGGQDSSGEFERIKQQSDRQLAQAKRPQHKPSMPSSLKNYKLPK
jgi:hypothetical protein